MTPSHETGDDSRQVPTYREGIAFGALSFGVIGVLSIVSSIVIARLYGIDVIGENALALAPGGALLYISSAREQAGLVRELSVLQPREPRVTGLFVAIMSFSTALTLVAGTLISIVAWLYFDAQDMTELFLPSLVVVLCHLVFANPCWNLDMMISSFRGGRELFWARLFQAVVYLVVAIAILAITDGVWGLIVALVASWGASLALRLWLAPRFMRFRVERAVLREGREALPGMVKFGLKMAPGMFAMGASQETPIWIIGGLFPTPLVGAYQRAWLVTSRLFDAVYRLGEMLFPTMVERDAQGDREGFGRAAVETARLGVVGLLLVAAVGAGSAANVMALFGAGFDQANNTLAVLLFVPLLFMCISVLEHTLAALDRPWLVSIDEGVRMVVTITACVVLAIQFGIVGAAIAIVLGQLVAITIMGVQTWSVLRPSFATLWPIREWIALAVAGVAGFAAARTAGGWLGGVVGLAPALLAGTVCFIAAFVLCGGLHARDRANLTRLAKRLRRTSGESAAE